MRTIKICPKCGAMSFIVTAHVTQDWVVDENGSYLHTQEECGEVTHQPDDSDIWTCNNCGYDAAGAEFNRKVADDYKPDLDSTPAADSGEDEEKRQDLLNGSWVLADDDSMQYIRHTAPLFPDFSNKNCWEVIQLVLRPDVEGGYGVAREHVDLSDYIGDDAPNDNKDDLDTILNSFGYAGVADVEVQYGLAADQVIAECIAETRFAELDRSELDYAGTEDDCTRYIKDYVGREN